MGASSDFSNFSLCQIYLFMFLQAAHRHFRVHWGKGSKCIDDVIRHWAAWRKMSNHFSWGTFVKLFFSSWCYPILADWEAVHMDYPHESPSPLASSWVWPMGEIWQEIEVKEEQWGGGSRGLEPAHTNSPELIVHISCQFCIQWPHFGSLKKATGKVFAPEKWVNTTNV